MATPSTTTAPNAPLFDLHSKVHLVTGAAQGLGLVLAAALLAQGSTVYALDMQPPPDAATNPALSDLQARYPGRLHYRRIDVRAAVALRALVADIAAAHAGRIDGLIAAAGIQQESPALEYVAADANRLLEVNVTGVLLTAQAVAAEMIKGGRGGSIVLIGSMSGTVANRVRLYVSCFIFISFFCVLCYSVPFLIGGGLFYLIFLISSRERTWLLFPFLLTCLP